MEHLEKPKRVIYTYRDSRSRKSRETVTRALGVLYHQNENTINVSQHTDGLNNCRLARYYIGEQRVIAIPFKSRMQRNI